MKIFDLDSPLMNVLNKMADLMWLNILTLICCIPIITAGAAFTSMHYVALKIVRNEESYITRSFFKSFKTNFRQATLIWLLILLIAAVLGGDYYIITKSGIQFSSVLVVLIMAAAVLVICTTLYVFPVLAKFDNTIMGTIRNAFIMSILQLPKTVVMFVMAFFPLIIYLVSLRLIPIIFLFGFSLPAYASAMLYNKFFQKLEDGDDAIQDIWDSYLSYLAISVTNLRMAFDCDIILGGYIGQYLKPYMIDLSQKMAGYNMFEQDTVYLKNSRYGMEAAAVGGAMKYIEAYFEELS